MLGFSCLLPPADRQWDLKRMVQQFINRPKDTNTEIIELNLDKTTLKQHICTQDPVWKCYIYINDTELLFNNCRFSHDITKIQTAKLLIPPIYYFNDVKEQLKTNIHTNVCSEWALGFVIDHAWISKLLRDAVFTWRPSWLKSDLFRDLFRVIWLSEQFLYWKQ